jgi:hypothetical protein
MSITRRLSVGDLVEVRSKAEIVKTLDQNAQLDGLPFMPEMFAFCGRQFRVLKRAHKTCDTVFPVRGRRMIDAVHLDTRCDGEAHGGCQAGCLIFWKEAWLKAIDARQENDGHIAGSNGPAKTNGCAEKDVWLMTLVPSVGDTETYRCQATQLPYATNDLSWWDIRQYVEDYWSGNVGMKRLASGLVFSGYRELINLGVGLGRPLRWFYDKVQGLRGGVPYPLREGRLPAGARTPSEILDLQVGEWVRVRNYQDILATCDSTLRNRGMYFDKEMVPFCGGTYRVLKRVERLIDEKTGKMLKLKNPCIVLDGVFCQSHYSECRLFCPRGIYCYWREIWLDRVTDMNRPACDLPCGNNPSESAVKRESTQGQNQSENVPVRLVSDSRHFLRKSE